MSGTCSGRVRADRDRQLRRGGLGPRERRDAERRSGRDGGGSRASIEAYPLFGHDLSDCDSLFAEKLDLLLPIREQTPRSFARAGQLRLLLMVAIIGGTFERIDLLGAEVAPLLRAERDTSTR